MKKITCHASGVLNHEEPRGFEYIIFFINGHICASDMILCFVPGHKGKFFVPEKTYKEAVHAE